MVRDALVLQEDAQAISGVVVLVLVVKMPIHIRRVVQIVVVQEYVITMLEILQIVVVLLGEILVIGLMLLLVLQEKVLTIQQLHCLHRHLRINIERLPTDRNQ